MQTLWFFAVLCFWHVQAGKRLKIVKVCCLLSCFLTECYYYSTEEKAGTTWHRITGGLKVVSAGQAGVWGVNKHDYIYYRVGTYLPGPIYKSPPKGSRWIRVCMFNF